MASVAITTIGKVPVTVGVPLNTPAVDNVKPAGNVLAVLKVTGAIPLVWVNVSLNGVPMMPVVTTGLVTTGPGFTNTVAVIGVPEQAALGVIVNVTVTGAFVVLVSAPLISPEPLAAIPVTLPVLSLVQSNVVPLTAPVRAIVVIVAPEQIVCDDGVATAFAIGFTSTVAVTGVPLHPLAVGVIVNVTVTGALVVLVSAPLILPAPPPAIPVTLPVLSLVQLNVVPPTLPPRLIVVIVAPEQMVCEAGDAITSGMGLTVIVVPAEGEELQLRIVSTTV